MGSPFNDSAATITTNVRNHQVVLRYIIDGLEESFSLYDLQSADDDSAAASAGVSLNEVYRTGSTLKVRIF